MQRPQVFRHLKLYLSSLQKSSLSEAVPYSVFTLHQYEPKPGMSLSLQAGGGGLGGCGGGLGGGGADGGSPSHKLQVFLHRCFFSSEYFLHFFFLQTLSVSTHGGGLLGGSGGGGGNGGGGEGDGGGSDGDGGGGEREGGRGEGEGGGGDGDGGEGSAAGRGLEGSTRKFMGGHLQRTTLRSTREGNSHCQGEL